MLIAHRSLLIANLKGWDMKTIIDFLKDEEGATMAEYGLLAVLIAVACVGAVTALGGNVHALFDNSVTQFP